MFKVGLSIPKSEDNPWMESPGVVSGCEVEAGPGLQLSINPGKLNFMNGFSAEVTHKIENAARIVPTTSANRLDYLVCLVRKDNLDFVIQRGEETNSSRRHLPRVLKSGILLAKIYVVHPCLGKESIFVYNIMPARGELSAFSFRPFDIADGIKTSFKMALKVKSEFCAKAIVSGVPQDQFIDYTFSDWTAPWGEVLSQIDFTEAPGNGSDILIKLYTGKVRLIA